MPDGSEIRDPETALTNFSVGPNCFPYGSFDTCTSTSTVQPCAESSCTPAGTRSRHEEPEHLDLNLVWALRYAQTICHTNFDPCVQVLHAGNMYCNT